jgi:hypothetical protein
MSTTTTISLAGDNLTSSFIASPLQGPTKTPESNFLTGVGWKLYSIAVVTLLNFVAAGGNFFQPGILLALVQKVGLSGNVAELGSKWGPLVLAVLCVFITIISYLLRDKGDTGTPPPIQRKLTTAAEVIKELGTNLALFSDETCDTRIADATFSASTDSGVEIKLPDTFKTKLANGTTIFAKNAEGIYFKITITADADGTNAKISNIAEMKAPTPQPPSPAAVALTPPANKAANSFKGHADVENAKNAVKAMVGKAAPTFSGDATVITKKSEAELFNDGDSFLLFKLNAASDRTSTLPSGDVPAYATKDADGAFKFYKSDGTEIASPSNMAGNYAVVDKDSKNYAVLTFDANGALT